MIIIPFMQTEKIRELVNSDDKFIVNYDTAMSVFDNTRFFNHNIPLMPILIQPRMNLDKQHEISLFEQIELGNAMVIRGANGVALVLFAENIKAEYPQLESKLFSKRQIHNEILYYRN